METIEVSNCCHADLVEDFKGDHHDPIEIYTCKKCKQECDVEDICAICLGSGEEIYDESDGEGHMQRGVGSRPCPHLKADRDDQDQDQDD
jgi:hypothetical protein